MNAMKWFRSRRTGNNDTSDLNQQIHTQAPIDNKTPSQAQRQPPANNPTVIEVFQSQGCNSCPPTNSLLLSKMAQDNPNVLILDYHVTYWDHLGWKDPFGIPDADTYQRQYAYTKGTSRVYTPQVIVNGVVEGVGNSKNSLESLIEQGERKASQKLPWLVFSEIEEGGILITDPAGQKRQGRVIEVFYDPASYDVHIPRGENARKTLTQRNTVKRMKDLGTWEDGQGPLQISRRGVPDGLQRVLIVQEGKGGPIIGVSRISV